MQGAFLRSINHVPLNSGLQIVSNTEAITVESYQPNAYWDPLVYASMRLRKFAISAISCHEILMRSTFNDNAVTKEVNAISIPDST